MNLLIISNMAHYRARGVVYGWGPVVREIDHLAALFDDVRHLAMLHDGPPPPTALPYSSPKISFSSLTPSGGLGLRSKLGILARSPRYLAACLRELRRADAVHVRCPANISLEALLLLRFVKQPGLRWVKYAGNWRPEGRDPFFYRLQRRWIEEGIHKGFATVNGEWPGQQRHVISLSNPCFTEAELEKARAQTRDKRLGLPLRLLFAGRLSASKGARRALHIFNGLCSRGFDARLDLAGDGPERRKLAELSTQLGLSDSVAFHGWLPRKQLDELYRQCHFLVLPSSTEGWPKVLSEAMAFGAVPVAAAVSCISQTLDRTAAGITAPVEDIDLFVEEITKLANHPVAWSRMAANGQSAAAEFTYEAYVERVCQLLEIERPPKAPLRTTAVA